MKVKLSHKEEEIMQILWKLKKAFVKDLIEHLPDPKPPYNTISSLVRKLEKEGIVGYEAFGKTHRYYAVLKEKDYRKTTFSSMMKNYFGGSPQEMLSYFVREEKLTPEEIQKLLEDLK